MAVAVDGLVCGEEYGEHARGVLTEEQRALYDSGARGQRGRERRSGRH